MPHHLHLSDISGRDLCCCHCYTRRNKPHPSNDLACFQQSCPFPPSISPVLDVRLLCIAVNVWCSLIDESIPRFCVPPDVHCLP